MADLQIIPKTTGELRPYSRNARTHSPKQIAEIAASIEAFGFNNPVLIDKNNGIVAGHGRVEAAKQLGIATVPTIRLEHLSEAQKRAYIIADNRLAERRAGIAKYFAIELQNLADFELDIDVSAITGFATPEIDVLIAEISTPSHRSQTRPTPCPTVTGPAVPASATSGRSAASPHLRRRDCPPETYERGWLAGKNAQMVFTDPPYNVHIDGHVSGLGKAKHRGFAMASGEMTEAEFTGFLSTVFAQPCRGFGRRRHSFRCDGLAPHRRGRWRRPVAPIPLSRTCASGPRPTAAWVRSTARSTRWSSSLRAAPRLISTTSNSAATAATARTFGATPAPTRSRPRRRSCHASDRQASRARCRCDPRAARHGRHCTVLDAFAGSGTTLVAAQDRPARLRHRARPALLRRRPPPAWRSPSRRVTRRDWPMHFAAVAARADCAATRGHRP